MSRSHQFHALAYLFAAALLLSVATPARADVRLIDDGSDPDGPGLTIRLSPAGPWSLVGPFDETVLNPAGDSYSDGLPDDAPQANSLLAGWVRPGDGRLHLSRWNETAWTPLAPFEAEESIGTPRVDALGQGWAVVWQQYQLDPMIRAAGVSGAGQHFDSEPIIPGWLLDVAWMGDVQLVLHFNADRSALLITGVLWSIPGVPSPVDIVFSVEVRGIDDFGDWSDKPSPQLAPVEKPGHGKGAKPVHESVPKRMVVSWWDAEGELQQAIVDQDGDLRHLGRARFDPDAGLAGTHSGRY